MKKFAVLSVVVLLVAVFIVGLMAASYSPGNITLGTLNVHDPRIDAQATAISQAAKDAAIQRAVETQKLQAQADKEKVEAEATKQAQTWLVWRNRLIAGGIGLGVLLLCVGVASAAVKWLDKEASSIRPNQQGIYPVVVKNFRGGVVVHDPNRAIGPTTIYTLPGMVENMAHAANLQLAQPGVSSPMDNEQAQLQITSQAQAIALLAAATPQKAEQRTPKETMELAKTITSRSMPQLSVRVLDEHEGTITQLLEAGE